MTTLTKRTLAIFVSIVFCPLAIGEGVWCEPPLVPKGCGTACPPTCDDPNPICTEQCVPENICSCPDGYVQRSAINKTCVRLSECLSCKYPAVPIKCDGNCPATCEAKGFLCIRRCESEYVCGCPEGYIQKSMEDHECLKEQECMSMCEKPMVYASCASLCLATCDNSRPGACKRGCNPQVCICPQGMVQISHDNKTCTRVEDCPATCEDRCGSSYTKDKKCQCDDNCAKHGDCCPDFKALCVDSSCRNRCFAEYDENKKCQCDKYCERSEDCCNDYHDLCQRDE